MTKSRAIQIIKFYMEEELPKPKRIFRRDNFEARVSQRFACVELARRIKSEYDDPINVVHEYCLEMERFAESAHPDKAPMFEYSAFVANDILDIMYSMEGLR